MTAIALALSLLCGTAGALLAAAPSTRVEKVSLFGKDYVRLDQWARANSFQWRWDSKEDLQVWNGAHRMHFGADSRKSLLDGVTLLLSEPMANRNGIPYLANVDLTSALLPVLFPPRNRPGQRVKHICLDPGHGGRDPGYSAGREEEKKHTLLLAQELADQLRRKGYTVSFTRTSDTFVDLPNRPETARRRGADLFISLHFNSAGTSSEVRGVEVYCMTPPRAMSTNARGERSDTRPFIGNVNNPKNMVLAYELEKAIVRGAGLEDRGVKRARFEVLRNAEMPAVLIEGGFLSNPAEARKIFSATWRKQMAQSIVAGVQSYQKIVER